MSVVSFKASANGSFTNQPNSTGEKLVVRSSNAGDTMNLTVIGYSSSVATSETLALTGTTAKQTTNTFESLTQTYLASAPAGQVEILGQGQQATGSTSLTSNPSVGATVVIAGNVTYTAVSPEVSTVTTVADVAGATSGLYFDAQDKNGTVRCWNNVDGVGVAPATPGGGRLLPVVYATGETADNIATAIAAAFDADAQFESSAASNVVTIYDAALGNRTNIAVGTSTFSVATVTSGAANNVANTFRLGINLYQTTKSLASAILATGTAGDNWGIGTVANTIYDIYSDGGLSSQTWNGTSDQVIYWQDKIAVNRGGSFAISDTSSAITTVSPTGGSDGAVIVILSAGSFQITTEMVFSSPDLVAKTLLALTTPTTDFIYLSGRTSTIHTRTENISSAVTAHLESSESPDGPWTNRSATFAITNLDNNQQFLQVTDHCEYIRLVIDTNANTSDSAVHLVVIF